MLNIAAEEIRGGRGLNTSKPVSTVRSSCRAIGVELALSNIDEDRGIVVGLVEGNIEGPKHPNQ